MSTVIEKEKKKKGRVDAYREAIVPDFPRLSFCLGHLATGICSSQRNCVDCGLVGDSESDSCSE